MNPTLQRTVFIALGVVCLLALAVPGLPDAAKQALLGAGAALLGKELLPQSNPSAP